MKARLINPPTIKYRRHSISPFKDFLVDSKKTIKGTSKATSK
jgi:hypothetical protein